MISKYMQYWAMDVQKFKALLAVFSTTSDMDLPLLIPLQINIFEIFLDIDLHKC